MAALVRGDKAKWLHDFSDITSKYRADRMEWILKDAGFGDTTLRWKRCRRRRARGWRCGCGSRSAQAGDRLIWVCGGAVRQPKSVLDVWDVTTAGREKTLAKGFSPDDCLDQSRDAGWRPVRRRDHRRQAERASTGQCSVASKTVRRRRVGVVRSG